MTNMPEEIYRCDNCGYKTYTEQYYGKVYSCCPERKVVKYIRADLNEWQPIETAPRDGTYILMRSANFRPAVVSWETFEYRDSPLADLPPRWCEDIETFGCADDYELAEYLKSVTWEPTHWMPLPKPPEAINDD